jgi:hypothetical protein
LPRNAFKYFNVAHPKMELSMAWKQMLFVVGAIMSSICFVQGENFISEKDAFSHEENTAELDKVYVSLDQLMIDENGMFLFVSETLLPVSALFRDQRGFYVMNVPMDIPLDTAMADVTNVAAHILEVKRLSTNSASVGFSGHLQSPL